jgi:hypothetical protein
VTKKSPVSHQGLNPGRTKEHHACENDHDTHTDVKNEVEIVKQKIHLQTERNLPQTEKYLVQTEIQCPQKVVGQKEVKSESEKGSYLQTIGVKLPQGQETVDEKAVN